MKPWWRFVLRGIPSTVSANTVSLFANTGSIFALTVLVSFGASHGREKPWIFALAAVGIFFYHTLDSVDGMQARRIGASGPLGEFVDHWFDTFNVFYVPMGIIASFPIIPCTMAIAFLVVSVMADWITLREVEKTNILRFGLFSSEEGIALYFLFNLAIWFLGYDFWVRPSARFGVPPIFFVVWFGIIGCALSILNVVVRNKGMGIAGLAIELATFFPVIVWVSAFYGMYGDRKELIGGLFIIGFIGSRFTGDLLRERLLGLCRKKVYTDLILCESFLLLGTSLFYFHPQLPHWLPVIFVAPTVIVTMKALFHQFIATLKRVEEYLGVGMFDIPSGAVVQPETSDNRAMAHAEADNN